MTPPAGGTVHVLGVEHEVKKVVGWKGVLASGRVEKEGKEWMGWEDIQVERVKS